MKANRIAVRAFEFAVCCVSVMGFPFKENNILLYKPFYLIALAVKDKIMNYKTSIVQLDDWLIY